MATTKDNSSVLLEVQDLRTTFATEYGHVPAVDGVSWSVRRGETLAIVGESGCGKSVTALSIMRLIPNPPGKIIGGRLMFHDDQPVDLLSLSDRQMRRIRGNRIAMVFQEPMSALNPVLTIGDQIGEAVELHQNASRAEARDVSISMLKRVGFAAPEQRVRDYPHQLSGGMRQRVMIAMALSCNPALLIADEPTTALDVTVQAQILALLRELQEAGEMSIIIITHDLSIVAEIADRVCVMYAGKIVEQADVHTLFANPLHPYTQGLLRSRPSMSETRKRLEAIPGTVPDPIHFPAGCRFHPRCHLTQERSSEAARHSTTADRGAESVNVLARCVRDDSDEPGGLPALRQIDPGHYVACWETDGYERGR